MPVFNKMVYNGTEYILGGGGNIGEPLNLTVTSAGLDATITWEDNEIGTIPPTTFQKSELVRKIGSAPTSPSDGDLVVTETVKDTYKVSGYVDSGLTDGETYYYRVFSYSDLGGISYCDAVSVTIQAQQPIPTNGLIAYYPFDGDMLDHKADLGVIGTTYDCTLLRGQYIFDTGHNNHTQAVKLGDSAQTWGGTLSTGLTSAFTFGTIMFRFNSYVADIFLCSQSLDWNNNGFKFSTTHLKNGASDYTFSIPADDKWHLLVLVNETNNTTSIYLDGAIFGTTSFNCVGGNDFVIGVTVWDGLVRGFYGNDFCIYDNNTRLTAQEISDYYDQTKITE